MAFKSCNIQAAVPKKNRRKNTKPHYQTHLVQDWNAINCRIEIQKTTTKKQSAFKLRASKQRCQTYVWSNSTTIGHLIPHVAHVCWGVFLGFSKVRIFFLVQGRSSTSQCSNSLGNVWWCENRVWKPEAHRLRGKQQKKWWKLVMFEVYIQQQQ